MSDSTSPRARGDQYNQSQDEQMSLAPYPSRRHEEEAGYAHAEQEVPCQERDVSEVQLEPHRQGERIGGKDGTQGRREDGCEREDEGDGIALPEGPVQRVVWVIRRLGVLFATPFSNVPK